MTDLFSLDEASHSLLHAAHSDTAQPRAGFPCIILIPISGCHGRLGLKRQPFITVTALSRTI